MAKFDVAVWADTRVKQSVVPFIGGEGNWEPWKVAMRNAIMKDEAYGTGRLLQALSNNPTSGLLALAKCAQLGLSPDPQLEHFALVPRGGAIQGEVMWRGWQHLALGSGKVEWIHADVIYHAEYAATTATMPLRDPITNRINHLSDAVARDEWGDKDIVASYAMAKVRGVDRLVSIVLSRKELDRRRKLAQTDKVWAAHYAKMCMAKAVKSLVRLGQLPLSTDARAAFVDDDDVPEDTPVTVIASEPHPDLGPPVGAMTVEPAPKSAEPAPDALFDALDNNPLPDDSERRDMLLTAIEQLQLSRDMSASELDELAGGKSYQNIPTEDLDKLLGVMQGSKDD